MSERSIVITPTLTNTDLRAIQNWRMGPEQKKVERAFMLTLNELTEGKVNWGDVMKKTEQTGLGFKSTSGAVAREAAVKIGVFAQFTGWDYFDPKSVLYIGLFGQEKVNNIAVRLRNRHTAIVTRQSVFESEALRIQAEQRTGAALREYDNADSNPPGIKQIVDNALTTYIHENPELESTHLQELMRGLIKIGEFARFMSQPAKRRPLLAALNSGQYDQALIALTSRRETSARI